MLNLVLRPSFRILALFYFVCRHEKSIWNINSMRIIVFSGSKFRVYPLISVSTLLYNFFEKTIVRFRIKTCVCYCQWKESSWFQRVFSPNILPRSPFVFGSCFNIATWNIRISEEVLSMQLFDRECAYVCYCSVLEVECPLTWADYNTLHMSWTIPPVIHCLARYLGIYVGTFYPYIYLLPGIAVKLAFIMQRLQ